MLTLQAAPSALDLTGLEVLDDREMMAANGGGVILAGCLVGSTLGFMFVVAVVAGVVIYAYVK
jgi:hypothetical protein